MISPGIGKSLWRFYSQMALLAMIGGEEKLFQEEKGGEITMCTALRELMRDSEEIGMQKGMQKGIQYGMENMMELIRKLSEYGKMGELDKVIAEEISIEQLMKQYGISD